MTKSIFDLDDGWECRREAGTGLDRMILTHDGAAVWEMEIPPKIGDAELVSQAVMLREIYRRGCEAGFAKIKREVAMLEVVDI